MRYTFFRFLCMVVLLCFVLNMLTQLAIRKQRIRVAAKPPHYSDIILPVNFCKQLYGRIALVTLVTTGDYMTNVAFNALQSVRCYAKMRGYDLYQIQYDGTTYVTGLKDSSIPDKCKRSSFMASRHCIIAHLLVRYDYIVHLDADSGVINTNHCFEEYITPGIDVFLLERVHSGEIQAGHYIVKNTTYARDFLLKWYQSCSDSPAESDNGILMLELFKRLPISNYQLCMEMKRNNSLNYFGWVKCMWTGLNGARTFNHTRIYRRAHAFVRDAWTSKFRWSDRDFLLHALKFQDDRMYRKRLNASDCRDGVWNLPVDQTLHVDVETMKGIWRAAELKFIEENRAIEAPYIMDCWPDCPAN